MSHLPLSLMNSLNKTESADFQTLETVFPKDFFTEYLFGQLRCALFVFDQINFIFMRPLYEAVILCDCIIKFGITLNIRTRNGSYWCFVK